MKMQFNIPPYLGLKDIKKVKDGYKVELGFSKRLKKYLTVDTKGLHAFLNRKKLSAKIESELISANIIKEDFRKNTPEDLKRYDRHMLFFQSYDLNPVDTQKILQQKTIALIGMGGIGNWVGLNLIGAGFKELRLIDFDTIELSNLTRQVLFDEKSIGQSKVKVAKNILQKKNSQTKVYNYDEKITGVEFVREALKDVDFIIISADRPAQIHDWINIVAVEYKIPYLNIGYRDTEGVVGPLTVPGKTSCYQCFKKDNHQKSNKESSQEKWDLKYQAPSFGPLNSLISSLGALEVIKYFTKFGQCESMDTELTFDPVSFKISKVKYHRDLNCHECGQL